MRIIETHFACVFLTRDAAYKLKKPVRRGSMDYRSIASRERGCRAELRLNRRLAPDVYHGVVALRRQPDGSLALGGSGRIVDWLVRMRRLPAGRMLDVCIAESAVSAMDRRAITAMLSSFYAHARRHPLSAARYRRALLEDVEGNGRALERAGDWIGRSEVRRTVALLRSYIARHGRLLAVRSRHLLDAHGDLRPEHIFLGTAAQRPCVIDCLEFDAALRRLDPAEEMAFLALECRRLGASRLGYALLHGVLRKLGERVEESLLYFYESRRALTRARLAAWRLRDLRPGRKGRLWRARTRAYLADALRLVRRAVAPTHQYGCQSTRAYPNWNHATGNRPGLESHHGRRKPLQQGSRHRARVR